MTVVLHPRASADRSSLQIWIMTRGHETAPELRWFVDGAPVPAQPVRDLRQVPGATSEPLFTGVFALPVPGAGRSCTVRAECHGRHSESSPPLRVRGLPRELGDDPFNVLLASCYYAPRDGGVAGVVSRLPASSRPHLTVLCGDQVYLDVPTLNVLDDLSPAGFTSRLTGTYVEAWSSPRYSPVLDAAPAALLPDDHEFWNNAPHASPAVRATWSEDRRELWWRTGMTLYDAFQRSEPAPRMLELDIDPISVFLLDTRTGRLRDRSRSVDPASLAQFRAWSERVRDERRYGVVVTGQSLFQPPAGPLKSRIADRGMANYGDYPAIMRIVRDLSRAGRPVLCLTGDVHYNRVVDAREPGTGARIVEVIASPTALVESVGADQAKRAWNFVRNGFRADPLVLFPRPPQTRPHFSTPDGTGYQLRQLHPRGDGRGNHVAVLTFRRVADRIRVAVVYHAVSPEAARRRADPGVTFDLSPTV